MGLLLGLLLVFVVVLAILLGLSVGIAFLLRWLLPTVGLDMALLIAVLAVGQTMLIFGRLVGGLPPVADETESADAPPPIVILDREVALPRRRRTRR
jgi:hypothetical protein